MADHNVCMISTCPLTSKSSSLLTNPLEIVTTTGITFMFMFHSFFLVLLQGPDTTLFDFFYFLSVIHWDNKVHYSAGAF